jgi:hypothetical protein
MTETAAHAPRRVKAAILRALAGSAHPKLEASNLAHRFNMTVEDVKAVAAAHGGIEQPTRLLRAAQVLEQAPGQPTVQAPVPDARRAGGVAAAPATPPTLVPQRPPELGSVEQLLARADKSSKTRTRNAAAKIRGLVDALHQVVEAEAADRREKARVVEERRVAEAAAREERERARAEVEVLEKKLAKAKAKLRGKKTTKAAGGEYPCPVTGCGRTFASSQGVALHRTRTHRAQLTEAS